MLSYLRGFAAGLFDNAGALGIRDAVYGRSNSSQKMNGFDLACDIGAFANRFPIIQELCGAVAIAAFVGMVAMFCLAF